jgi:NAD(P)-dependent dehydrogenase (short-subunit alcohol dehydrogenase family)
MSRAFASALIREGGAIVNILSISALGNIASVGSYSASKAAARSMSQGLRAEFREHGVRVIAVYPTGYDTDMSHFVEDKSMLFPPRMLTAAVLASLVSGGPDEIYPDPSSQQIGQMAKDDLEGLLAMMGQLPE